MKTLKELADIGAAEAYIKLRRFHTVYVDNSREHYPEDEPARQAFAQAVRDAVLAELVTKPDSSPTFEAHGFTWNRHTPSDPMPCDGEALVEWLLMSEADGGPYSYMKAKAANVVWSVPVGWRYAEPTPPATKTAPLDISDIRATDEFRPCGEVYQICTLRHANENGLSLLMHNGMIPLTYEKLATHYLRRKHSSDEWKPCTKEVEG